METNEIATLIKFFKNEDDDDGVFDLTDEEFLMITNRTIHRDLKKENTVIAPYGRSNPGMGYCLTKYAQTANDEDFYKLSYELLKYYITNKNRVNAKTNKIRSDDEITYCVSVLCKYYSPAYIYYRNIQQVNMQVEFDKLNDRIIAGDFDGAITYSRTIVEKFLKDCLQQAVNAGISKVDNELKQNYDINKLGKAVFDCYNLLPESQKLQPWKQLAGGIYNLILLLSAVRNSFGDAHSNNEKSHLMKHHAELSANAAFTLITFLSAVVNNKLNSINPA